MIKYFKQFSQYTCLNGGLSNGIVLCWDDLFWQDSKSMSSIVVNIRIWFT
jgi:hypothetical protein